MYCSRCDAYNQDGAHFCQNCGNPLQAPGAVIQRQPVDPYPVYPVEEEEPAMAPSRTYSRRRSTRTAKPRDPYLNQIKQLKLQIKQMKLYLKQVNTQMSATRAQYNQTSAFIPDGFLKKGYKWFEDMRLLGPQQQKQQLQQQILQLEQELLGLEQAQTQWKMQQE